METDIYVYMLDEGVDVWRPVHAEVVGPHTFRIVAAVPDEEIWQFQPGDIVRCEQRKLSGGAVLVAVERIA